MTDKEVIKALECHAEESLDTCSLCPLLNIEGCAYEAAEYALNLINRQQAEIERLAKLTELDDKHIKNLEKAFNDRTAELQDAKLDNKQLRRDVERLDKRRLNDFMAQEKYNSLRTEAVKEFAEKLKDRILNFPSAYPIESATLAFLNGSSHRQLEILEIIDNLVKEMEGDTE